MTVCSKCKHVHRKFKNGRVKKTCERKGGFSNPLTARPKSVQDLLNRYGAERVIAIKIGRHPINAITSYLVHEVSGEKLKEIERKYSYDDLMHLWVILYLSNGKSIRVEKAPRVVVTYDPKTDTPDETPVVKCPRQLTLNELFNEYEKRDTYFYDPVTHNCQVLAKTIANSLGVNQYDSYIKQNIEKIIPLWMTYLLTTITSGVSLGDYAVHGGGRRRR